TRLRDDLRQAFDGPHQDLVRELEREVQRLSRDQVQELVIRDRDHGVRRIPEPLQSPFCALQRLKTAGWTPSSKRCSARCGPTSRSSASVEEAVTRSPASTARGLSVPSSLPATRMPNTCSTLRLPRRSSSDGGSRRAWGPAPCRRSARRPPARRRKSFAPSSKDPTSSS